jgi:ABC-2 type transport system ATP-binding protein
MVDYPAIKTTNLTKRFTKTTSFSDLILHPLRDKQSVFTLNNINLEIKRGEIFGLIGLNGAGKTTLIKILSCLILPDNGEAYVNGYHIMYEESKIKQSVGLVTGEERGFYWRLTGRQNLTFFAALCNLSKKESSKRISDITRLLEIDTYLDEPFQKYSSGIKQKFGIARSLLHNPQILFMDEPTKSMDPIAASNLRKFIRQVLVNKQNKTIFFTTHQLEEAENFSDRIAIMHEGKIKIIGSLMELKKSIPTTCLNLEDIFRFYTKE